MNRFAALLSLGLLTSLSLAQPPVRGDLYGTGTRGVILAHGGRFDEKSWRRQAEVLANSGFLVFALHFRGDRHNPDGSPSAEGSTDDNATDVLAAAAHLRQLGAKTVYAVGASLGGDAVGEANLRFPAAITRMVFLGTAGPDAPEKLIGRKLFIVARDDANDDGPRLPRITKSYDRASEPKKLVILEGSAHAQFLFATDQGPRLFNEILRFLSAP